MAGDSLTQISLTGHGTQDQHHLQIHVQITIILVGQVRKMQVTYDIMSKGVMNLFRFQCTF